MSDNYKADRDFVESIKLGFKAIRARESSKPEHARNYNFAQRELEPGEPVTDRVFGVPL